MPSSCKTVQCQLFLACLSCLGALNAFLFAELFLPDKLKTAIADVITLDTEAKFEKTLGKETTIETTIVFFNLTNAYELQQNLSPPVKPIFQEVRVPFIFTTESFDYTLSNDGRSYSYKTWTRAEPVDPEHAHLVIVQVNSMLISLFSQFGGERVFKEKHAAASAAGAAAASTDPQVIYDYGCDAIEPNPGAAFSCRLLALTYAYLLYEKTQPLKSDGTGELNVGLFVQRTVNDLFNGMASDPLSGLPNPGRVYGTNKFPTLEHLKDALAAGSEPAGLYQTTKLTGKERVLDAGKYVSFHTYSNVSMTRANDLWFVPPTAYDNMGHVGSGKPFVISGLRSDAQPLPPLTNIPSVMVASYPPEPKPSASYFKYFDAAFSFREVAYSCGNCKHEKITGLPKVIRYSLGESSGQLKKNGNHDLGGTCSSTNTCDYGERHPWVWTTRGLFSFSLPYFGKSSDSLTGSVTFLDGDGEELAYTEATMPNDMHIEPFSGMPLKIRKHVQENMNGFTPTVFNDDLYSINFANIPDVWPVSLLETDFQVNAKDVKEFSAFNNVYLMMMISHILAFLSVAGCIHHLHMVYKIHREIRGNATIKPKAQSKICKAAGAPENAAIAA